MWSMPISNYIFVYSCDSCDSCDSCEIFLTMPPTQTQPPSYVTPNLKNNPLAPLPPNGVFRGLVFFYFKRERLGRPPKYFRYLTKKRVLGRDLQNANVLIWYSDFKLKQLKANHKSRLSCYTFLNGLLELCQTQNIRNHHDPLSQRTRVRIPP